ncbi:MAG: BAX inhibitor (BI)-1/YccA family protein [Proteobacteria bacterium]|nr:BAX inhibitor (BI)-1/YccA family protein [Pseudomonadota bacterium]
MIQHSLSARTDAPSAVAVHMRQVFNYMTGGVALTGAVAWYLYAFMPQLLMKIATSPVMWLLIAAELGVVFFLSFRIQSLQPATALALFAGYSALNGITLAPLAFVYTGASIAQAFIVAACMFAAMSLYGYTTKRSLSAMGSFLYMCLWGLVAAMLVQALGSAFFGMGTETANTMSFVISLLAVPVFAGLTAWDTQKIKLIHAEVAGDEANTARAAVMGALTLYLDFINLFIHLLRLMGERR